MRVVVPYTEGLLATATREAVTTSSYPHEFVKMGGDYNYATMLKDLMRDGQDTILVEHDIIPTHDQLNELALCEYEWCAYAYPPFEDREYSKSSAVVGLGLCKLGTDLLSLMLGVWPTARWDHCDFMFSAIARQYGFIPHQHHGDVKHLLTRHGGHYP